MDEITLKEKFEKRMLDWGFFYPEYVGCELLDISEDNEIKGSGIYPSAGDWVVNDVRGKSGTYGVRHDDYSIYEVKVKKPKEHGLDYTQKPIPLKVSARRLMSRYIKISMLYMNWAHYKTVDFSNEVDFNDKDDTKKTNQTYQKEKKLFVEDPYLALYWLNHFGATLDCRYNEVVKIIEDNKLTKKLELLKEPLAFFKLTDAFYDLEIQGGWQSKKEEFTELFLIRRAYLVYYEQSYVNYKPENLELWWKSISIYPKVEEHLIVRMRWLKNNLNKTNTWAQFDKHIENENKNIPLLSYVLACNPNTSEADKTNYANTLISELLTHKNHFKTPHKKQFAEVLLWDVKDFVSQKEQLQETTKFYFQGNETSKKYIDIQAVLGIKNKNLSAIKTALERLNIAFEGFDKSETTEEEIQYYQKITPILDTLPIDVLLETATNIKNKELAKRCFVYLWNADIANKEETLVKLFTYIELSGYDFNKRFFGETFPHLIKDKNDPNIEIVKAFFTIPEADFENNYMWEESKEAATKFFLRTAHLPKIFTYLITTISQKPTKENKHLLAAIYTNLFRTDYDSNIDPTLSFSKEQIETMLETICNWFLKYGHHVEGERSIYYCANPLAEEWINKHLNDKKWLKQFSHIQTSFDYPLDKELKEAFINALEFIKYEKLSTYLEYKDEFWKISFFKKFLTVTYGKIGTKGEEEEKECKSEKECIKKGKKLIADKVKKGYKIIKKL